MKKAITVALASETISALDRFAQSQDRSRSWTVDTILRERLASKMPEVGGENREVAQFPRETFHAH